MADLTPELLAEVAVPRWTDNVLDRCEIHPQSLMGRTLRAVPALVTAAQERDQLRDALAAGRAESKKLEADITRLRALGLEAATIAARPEVTRDDILRAETILKMLKEAP